MEKKISMAKKRNQFLVETLMTAFDAVEGVYSGIPECCIKQFISGINYQILLAQIKKKKNSKELLSKLKLFNYVPCYNCLKNKRVNKLKHNGVSNEGRILFALIEIFAGKKNLGDDYFDY